jgi:hypothetical protein
MPGDRADTDMRHWLQWQVGYRSVSTRHVLCMVCPLLMGIWTIFTGSHCRHRAGPVVHVLDASRGVPVAQTLLDKTRTVGFVEVLHPHMAHAAGRAEPARTT